MGGDSSGPSGGSGGGDNDRSNGGLGSNADGLGDALGGISNGGWGGGPGSQGAMGAGGENALGGGDAAAARSGWGTNGFGLGEDGTVTGPQGFDSPGYGMSTAAQQAADRGYKGLQEGGVFNGGLLGQLFSGLNTLATFGVPGYAPIGTMVGLANTGIGALNSLGVTNTGSLGPSLGETADAVKNGIGGLFSGEMANSLAGLTTPSSSPNGVSDSLGDPSGMLGGLQGGDYNPLADALVAQGQVPAATTPETAMPVQPGVPDPRSLAGLMAIHNPMEPVERPLAPMARRTFT